MLRIVSTETYFLIDIPQALSQSHDERESRDASLIKEAGREVIATNASGKLFPPS